MEHLRRARQAVLDVVDGAPQPAQVSKHVQEFSPLLWHLGHSAFIEAQWVGEFLAGDDALTRGLHGAFNALQVEKEKRPQGVHDMSWTLEYRKRVFAFVDAFIENPRPPQNDIAKRLLQGSTLPDFLAQHHFQHAEPR
jgi:hypothetical protein